MITKYEDYCKGALKNSYDNPHTGINVPGYYIRLFESMEESNIDYDVKKYHDISHNHGPIEYLGMSSQFHGLFHSDILILKKVLQFKGKKFVLLKNQEIACVFTDLNFLIRALVELDLEGYGSSSPVNTIIDADTGQALFLFCADAYHVHCNF